MGSWRNVFGRGRGIGGFYSPAGTHRGGAGQGKRVLMTAWEYQAGETADRRFRFHPGAPGRQAGNLVYREEAGP